MIRSAGRLLLFLVLLLVPSVSGAVLYIDINAPGGKRMPIALPDFVVTGGDASLARKLPEAIGGDLAMTSLFDVIPRPAYLERIVTEHFSGRRLSFPDWKMIGTEAVVIGQVEVRGDQMMVEMRLYDASLGKMMIGKKYTGPASQFRKMAHKFANEVLYAFTGVRGIFDTEIAFSARPEKGKGKEIYIIGLDGSELRQVTDNRSFNLFPRWSPDGKRLAYTSYRTGLPQIYLRNLADGTDRIVARYGNSKSPGSFSPSGDSLYATLSVEGNSDIYRVSLAGSGVQRVVGGWGIEVSPSVSPDGKSLAFVSNRGGSPQIYVKEYRLLGREARLPGGTLLHLPLLVPRRRPDRLHLVHGREILDLHGSPRRVGPVPRGLGQRRLPRSVLFSGRTLPCLHVPKKWLF